MHIYPAIDIRGGKCVRLLQGKAEHETVYGENPLTVAKKWAEEGAKRLHVVDLDGAFGSSGDNFKIITQMANEVGVPIQLGGGMRSIEKIRSAIDAGIEKVILGTLAIEQPSFVSKALDFFGEKIAVGIDAKGGYVAIKGWTQDSKLHAFDLAVNMKDLGVKTLVYTDISKDGMLSGPDFDGTSQMVETTGLYVIASGGITSVDDIKKLKCLGVSGVIIGKALYTGDISLRQALELEV